MTDEIIVTDSESVQMFQDGVIDVQVTTARKFPRNERRLTESIIKIIVGDKSFAEKCMYAKPVAGKNINGISVHLARLMAKLYGNLRVEVRLVKEEHKRVICEAIAWDLESNFAVKREAIKSIFSVKNNQRYSDDVINTTIEACKAIAYRNAVLDIIPEDIKANCYKKAIEMITGDLSSESKLIAARNAAMKYMIDTYAITEEQALSLVGCKTITQVNSEKIAELKGIVNAINAGEFNINDHFAKQTTVQTNTSTETLEKWQKSLNDCKTINDVDSLKESQKPKDTKVLEMFAKRRDELKNAEK